MHLKSRAFRSVVSVLSLLSLAGAGVAEAQAPARTAIASATTPWLYRGSDVPQDPEWLFGELPNGLRYAVRKNGVPPRQVSIRIRMDVGSLYEKPDRKSVV